MKTTLRFFSLLLLAGMSAQAAQLYRWVDSKGNVEWRDTPPPAAVPAKNIEQRRVGGNLTPSADLPFAAQRAVKNHPVTLWGNTECGKICESARAHLAKRGIPYTEKAPQSDVETFKKLSPTLEIPLLQVGNVLLKGYLEPEWDNTLDAAGYPRSIPARPKPLASVPAAKPAADGAKPPEMAAAPPAAK